MMKFLFIVSALFARDGGDWVGNAGISEVNFAFAFENVETYLGECLQTRVCELSGNQRQVAQAIFENMPNEREAGTRLIFSDNQELFRDELSGSIGIARTRYRTGSPIWINQRLLYQLENGQQTYIGIARAYAILIHELGHHLGIRDHRGLDALGSRLARILRGKVDSDRAGKKGQLMSFVVNTNAEKSTSVAIQDSLRVIDLSEAIQRATLCPLELGGGFVERFFLRRAPTWWNGRLPFLLSPITLYCRTSQGVYEYQQSMIDIRPSFWRDSQGLLRLADNITIRHRHCRQSDCEPTKEQMINE